MQISSLTLSLSRFSGGSSAPAFGGVAPVISVTGFDDATDTGTFNTTNGGGTLIWGRFADTTAGVTADGAGGFSGATAQETGTLSNPGDGGTLNIPETGSTGTAYEMFLYLWDGTTASNVVTYGYTADNTAPAHSSAGTTSTTTIDVVFTEDLTGSTTATAPWTVKIGAVSQAIASVSEASGTVTLTISGDVFEAGDTITYSYNAGTGDLTDLHGNALASITDQAVTNNVVSSPTTVSAANTGGSSTRSLSVPATPTAGNLILTGEVAWRQTGTVASRNTLTGYTGITAAGNSDISYNLFARVADGTETGTLDYHASTASTDYVNYWIELDFNADITGFTANGFINGYGNLADPPSRTIDGTTGQTRPYIIVAHYHVIDDTAITTDTFTGATPDIDTQLHSGTHVTNIALWLCDSAETVASVTTDLGNEGTVNVINMYLLELS